MVALPLKKCFIALISFKLMQQKVIISLYYTTKSANVSKSGCYQIQTYGTGKARNTYGEKERRIKNTSQRFLKGTCTAVHEGFSKKCTRVWTGFI
jgi:hypothetical protein